MQSPTQTKLIGTIGPASGSRERLAEMLDAGLDVCRLNFSHGTLDDHARVLAIIRQLAAERDEPICVFGDLCGPKIRLNGVAPGAGPLRAGQRIHIVPGSADCTSDRLTTNTPALLEEVDVGHRVYIDDGLVRLLVTDRSAGELVCTVTVGGAISSRKGINVPDTPLSLPALTDKDRRDAAWALENQLDYVALSFVRRPEDVQQLRELIRRSGHDAGVIVKIEKREALARLDEIVAQADAVMVARGDLGVEMDVWEVPLAQKRIVRRCLQTDTPVIVATQMLQSMVAAPTPTRAEVSDVANAILDGADAVMLSAETASGAWPVAAVDILRRVSSATERYMHGGEALRPANPPSNDRSATSAIAEAAVHAALHLNAKLVAAWTATGATVRLISGHRLPMPVVGLTHNEHVSRRLNLLYGVQPIRVEPNENPAEMASGMDALLIRHKLAAAGDLVVVVTSTRPTTPGATDTVLIHRVGGRSMPL